MKELKDLLVDDSFLFEEIQGVNMYLEEEILKKWTDENVSMDRRGIETFSHFKQGYTNTSLIFYRGVCM